MRGVGFLDGNGDTLTRCLRRARSSRRAHGQHVRIKQSADCLGRRACFQRVGVLVRHESSCALWEGHCAMLPYLGLL